MTSPIETVEQLEELLSEPSDGAVEAMCRLEGDLIVLGVAGKMGPTLARMAKRASDLAGVRRRIIGVSRFCSGDQEKALQAHGIETIRCDLLDESAVQTLPDAPNVLYLAGMKFGSAGHESMTWALNAWLPAIVCRKFCRSRIVAFSTGNVYGLVPVATGGSREGDAPAPAGEYAMSCLGRERIFEHFSRALNIPLAIIRLNYACELRYGVAVDLAQKVFAGDTIDVSMGWFNMIWQSDASAVALQCLARAASPPFVINVTGPELLNVREVGTQLARRLGKRACFSGTESLTALLNNAQRALELFGQPRFSAHQVLDLVADWVKRGGPTLRKPTHFESRDGKF